MHPPRPHLIVVLLVALAAWTHPRAQAPADSAPAAGPVSVRDEVIVIPTYPTGEPLKAPMFFAGRTYQGAKGPMYPYVLVDRLGDRVEPRQYRIIRLENEFVRIGILPELGGRIWEGVDKTNGYDFFYKNQVIKPALIGMVGAWISGGVEWNIPHHHRASSFMPVDYRTERHPDGSATVWVGELEYRHRMRWTVGLTLTPGRSTVDATVRLVNRTPVAHSFLYFANVAVHANDQYQVVFPPRTEYGTHHAKREFTTWPVSRQVYGGVDFTQGVDVSWWKNHPTPTSIFAWNDRDEFLAGYDHGRQAGTMHVADHHTVPGKKFFEWGPGSEGRYWDGLLTDADGPYLELMVGGYSDNQPDYAWIQPGETKEVTQTWYPIRDIGAPKHATRDGAVNLEAAAAGAVRLAFNATARHENATVRLSAGDRTLFDRQVTISPGTPFSQVVTVAAGTAHTDLRAVLLAPDGRELVDYRPVASQSAPMPSPALPPPAPKDATSNDELYLAGLRLEQFYSPAAEPEPYYEEAIRRDPGDSRAHTALARGLIRKGRFAEAAAHAESAVARVSRNYTSPNDGEAHYYLGVARLGLGDDAGAEPVLGRAAWDPAWRTAAYTRMAEISARRRDWPGVVGRTATALETGSLNTRALVLRAIAHVQLTRPAEAQADTARALAIDPLDHWARHVDRWAEAIRARQEARRAGTGVVGSVLSSGWPPETALEMANDYATLGLFDQALAVLNDGPSPIEPSREHAMLHYARAEYAERLGRQDEAASHAALAKRVSTDYVFPFRVEHIALLERAMQRDPADARAPYYLGNLLMDIQPDRALRAWETARRLDSGFAMVHRNLGWVAARQPERLAEAIASYERAIEADPREPVFFYELDKLYEQSNTDPAVRLARLESHMTTVALRDDALSRVVRLAVQVGQYDRALQLLASRRYHTWEGGTRFLVHDDYVNAHLLRGHRRFAGRNVRGALEDYQAALDYPANLGIGKPDRGDRDAEVQYFVGLAWEALRQPARATASWQRAAANAGERPPSNGAIGPQHYFEARAFEKLGQPARARATFEALVTAGTERLARAARVDFFAKFGEQASPRARQASAHYLAGLGHLGLGRTTDARAAFERALALDVNHLGAQGAIATMRNAERGLRNQRGSGDFLHFSKW